MASTIPSTEISITRVMECIGEVAVLPHVVYKVLELSSTTEYAASELEKVVLIDPGFSTRLLTLANSAFYGLPKKVTSIREAVAFLGFRQIRQISMTIGFFDMFVGKNDRESLRRRTWWRHSIDTAVSCRWLASLKANVSPDEAYTCGLLHYIGKPLLDRYQAGAYDQVEHLITTDSTDDVTAERLVFGCDHIEVAIAACTKWRLPESLVKGLSYRRSPDDMGAVGTCAACVALGATLARATVLGPSEVRLDDWAMKAMGFDPTQADDLFERAIAVIASAQTVQL